MVLGVENEPEAGTIGITSVQPEAEENPSEQEMEVVETETESSQVEQTVVQPSALEKADKFLNNNQHWFVAGSGLVVIAVEGYWGLKKLAGDS